MSTKQTLVNALMLTAVHRRQRLEFARQYRNWKSTEWLQGAISDESSFNTNQQIDVGVYDVKF